MPRAGRHQPQAQPRVQQFNHRTPTPRPEELSDADEMEDEEFLDGDGEDDIDVDPDQGQETEAEAQGPPRGQSPPVPPPGLKEISSLASWTVSSSKPGCGVAALRNPSTALFWQSDGPQPHFLNIHFFKLVSIVAVKIYLDFELDESYTPTLIRFASGTGYNDLQVWSEMQTEGPRGWQDVDFDGVGDAPALEDDQEESLDEEEAELQRVEKMPALRCMLLQVRICENHQNGKDTHLRGLQIFARDEGARRRKKEQLMAVTTEGPGRRGRSGREILPLRTKSKWDLEELLSVPTLR